MSHSRSVFKRLTVRLRETGIVDAVSNKFKVSDVTVEPHLGILEILRNLRSLILGLMYYWKTLKCIFIISSSQKPVLVTHHSVLAKRSQTPWNVCMYDEVLNEKLITKICFEKYSQESTYNNFTYSNKRFKTDWKYDIKRRILWQLFRHYIF